MATIAVITGVDVGFLQLFGGTQIDCGDTVGVEKSLPNAGFSSPVYELVDVSWIFMAILVDG